MAMNVFQEIRHWAASRPLWQQDAIRRIIQHGKLSQDDVSDLYGLLKSEHQLGEDGLPTPQAVPLSGEETPGPGPRGQAVVLTSMHGLQNVNALASGQTLHFAHDGMSVFYGQNAAGKSGYSRVLKRACRAREIKEEILPDVFAESGTNDAAVASFDLLVDGSRTPMHWTSGDASPQALSSIAVFDSKCARLYVDDENSVVFVPYGLDVLPELVSLCGVLRAEIDRDMASCKAALAPLMALDRRTAVGKLVGGLEKTVSIHDLEQIRPLSESEVAEYKRLKTGLIELRASDPTVKATSLVKQAERLKHLLGVIDTLHSAVSRRQIALLRRLSNEAETARAAAELASGRAFEKEPVKGTGSDAWKSMYEAARDYSLQVAYPDKAFPFVGDLSRCVLCQQVLSDEAGGRLTRFEAFVTQRTAKRAEQSALACEDAVGQLESIDFAPHETNPGLLGDLEELDEQLLSGVTAHLTALEDRAAAIVEAASRGTWDRIPLPLPSTGPALVALETRLRESADKLRSSSRPDEIAKLESTVAELAGRVELDKHRRTVSRYLRLGECRAQANPKAISERQGQLMAQAVSEELRAALTAELTTLGMTHIQFDLRKKTKDGVTYHQLELPGAANSRANLSQVLSEGEQCVVGIASFLAEVAINPTMCGVVFDDPVCSLDQDWRMKIAERLVAEATKRQVVIFTHDIVFLLALNDEAAASQVPLHVQTIARHVDCIGVCDSEVPWDAGNVKSRLGILKNLATTWNSAEREGRNDDSAGIEREFYDKLRAAWEQAVEELVFRSVVQRFRKSVQTQQLRYVTLDNSDYLTITRAMLKCSDRSDAHDTGPGRRLAPVTYSDLGNDIKVLETFRGDLMKRQEAVEAERKALVAPPKAVVDD